MADYDDGVLMMIMRSWMNDQDRQINREVGLRVVMVMMLLELRFDSWVFQVLDKLIYLSRDLRIDLAFYWVEIMVMLQWLNQIILAFARG